MTNLIICPTITAFDDDSYSRQIDNITSFASRIHIDLMDGAFTKSKSPELARVWWPEFLMADIHLMFQEPTKELDTLIRLKPNLVIVHFEASLAHKDFTTKLHENNIKCGIAINQTTGVDQIKDIAEYYDHILIFSGHLGYHGGSADLELLDKVKQTRSLYPDKELSWDGGVNDQNAKAIADSGVNVLNVGSFIQDSNNPENAYDKIEKSLL